MDAICSGGDWTLLELLGWGTIHWHPNNKTKLKGQTLSEPRISITLTEVRRNNYRKTVALHQLFSTKRKPNKKNIIMVTDMAHV